MHKISCRGAVGALSRLFRPRAVALAAASLALPLLGAGQGRADPGPTSLECAVPGVTVDADSADDTRLACLGAARAMDFLGRFGLHPQAPIAIAVKPEIEPIQGAKLFGYYDPAEEIVTVLAGSAFATRTNETTVVGIPIDADMHASIFAHEVTHAILDQNAEALPLTAAGHEYLAYSVQIATLPAAHRRAVLDQFEGKAFSDPTQISDLVLAFDPNGFAVKAYLHFRDAEDQDAVLHALAEAPRWRDYDLY